MLLMLCVYVCVKVCRCSGVCVHVLKNNNNKKKEKKQSNSTIIYTFPTANFSRGSRKTTHEKPTRAT